MVNIQDGQGVPLQVKTQEGLDTINSARQSFAERTERCVLQRAALPLNFSLMDKGSQLIYKSI